MTRFCPLSLVLLMLAIAGSAAAQTPPYNRTVIVPSTGNATTDGAALISALTNLSPTPSGSTWLRGGGSIGTLTSATCAGVFSDAFTFFPNTCL